MSIDERAASLASELDVDEAEIQGALENLAEYSVPLDEAERTVRRRYGDGETDSGAPEPIDIANVSPDAGSVTVTGVVLTLGKRSIRYQGDDVVIREGEVADDTGRIAYTAWQEFGLEVGDTVRIGNAGVREWEGRPELNLGASTTVDPAEPIDVPYEVGGTSTLADLEAGDRGVTLDARVVEVERKTIDGRDGETEILDGVLGDESGRLPFTDWEPRDELTADASVRIENAYVREFRGVPSVNVSEFSTVTPLDEPVEVGDPAEATIGEAVASGGVYDVTLEGECLSVRDGSGLIERCPECRRVVDGGQCRSHGEVDPVDDLRVKAILDDGTGAVTVVLDRELTEGVYDGDIDDARDAAREAMDRSVVADAIAERIVGRSFTVRGHLSVDEYGATLDATAFDPVDESPADRARAFLEATA
jgi:replication factor A1